MAKSCCEPNTEQKSSILKQTQIVLGLCVFTFVSWIAVTQVNQKVKTAELNTLFQTQNQLLEKLDQSINKMVSHQQQSETQRAVMKQHISDHEKRISEIERAVYKSRKL